MFNCQVLDLDLEQEAIEICESLRQIVAGTPNRLEYDQGFFVKNGDGAAETAQIMNLEEVQVTRVFRDIERNRATTLPLHLTSLLVKEVLEI